MQNKKGKTPSDLVSALDSISAKVKSEPKLQQLQTNKQMLTYETLLENPAEISCRNGSVFGMNASPDKGAFQKCRKYIECHYHLFRLCKHGYTPTFWTLVTVLSVSVKS